MRTEPSGTWVISPKWDPRWEPVAVREYTADEVNEMTPPYDLGASKRLHSDALVLANRLGLDDAIRIDRVDIGNRPSVRAGVTVTFYRWVA